MPHSYASEYPPGVHIDDGIKRYFEDFYKTSDAPELHEKYADSFTEDAKFVLASKKVVGQAEILQVRKGMWTAVASRVHSPLKIFPFGADSNEVMIYGIVAYGFKDGRKVDVDWSARANLVKVGDTWKMAYYQVYLDTAAMQNAK